jgi:hypothetical protein
MTFNGRQPENIKLNIEYLSNPWSKSSSNFKLKLTGPILEMETISYGRRPQTIKVE